jgi:hypothetical protein
MTTVKVVSVHLNRDLRGIHAFRRNPRLRAGQCRVYVNRAKTQALIVDCAKGIHKYYPPEGRVIDTDILNQMCGALRIRLDFPDEMDARMKHAVEMR